MATILPLLAGQWFIVSTNFPMWLNGNRTDPSFHYTVSERNGQPVLLDEVSYMQNGKQRSIKGIDFPDRKQPGSFTWRGKGLLFLLKSKWQVCLMDEHNEWAVIHFSKTLFTPEGVDIIFRQKQPDESVLKEIKAKMELDKVLHSHIEKLVEL